jgi:hypothetical protein
MGMITALDLAENLDITLEQQIGMHLRTNHYPPVPLSMVSVCIEAIDACNDEDYDREITLPEGVLWRGRETAPANAIAEAHHLDSWIAHAHYCDCSDCIVDMNEDAGYEMGLGLE